MKYSVSIYSFWKRIQKGLMTPVDCVVAAKEMGFDAIELVDFVLGDEPEATAKAIREKADEVGLEISNIAVGANLLAEDGVEKVMKWVDLAHTYGIPYLRHDVAYGARDNTGFDGVLDELADACRKITEYAEQFGIRTMTENHGYFSQDSRRVEKLINRVAHKNFGHLIDMGNFLCADEDPSVAVGRNAGYCFYVHAKDFLTKKGGCVDPGEGFFVTRGGNYLRGTIIGHGDVPIVACLKALKKANFDGWLAVEFEGMEDPLDGVRIGLANLKRFSENI